MIIGSSVETIRVLLETLPRGRLRGRYCAALLMAADDRRTAMMELMLAQAELVVCESDVYEVGRDEEQLLQNMGELQVVVAHLKDWLSRN